ncbi:MAG: hotdog fold thioesterase [Runella sp.]
MFNKNISIEQLQKFDQNTLVKHLGIEYLEIGDDFITARMPVDERTRQPFGILHGGASVVLAETLGSIASFLALNDLSKRAVGLEINANHVRSVKDGWVYGKVTPLHVGRTTHLWQIEITNEAGKLVCISRLTIAVIESNK